jgi:hypothetical protein
MKQALYRKAIFFCSFLMLVGMGHAQEDVAEVHEPEAPIVINPEHFRLLLILTGLAVLAGVIAVVIRSSRRDKQKRADLVSQIEKAYKSGDILDVDHEELKKGLEPMRYDWLVKTFGMALTNKRRHNYLYSKYPKETAKDLFEYKHWIGMSIEQLIDSRGHADKTEDEILKMATTKILTYRTPNGEESFSFVKGVLEKATGK